MSKPDTNSKSETINYKDFNTTTAVSSGGVTGSLRIKMEGKNYQVKPSIRDNTLYRWLKAGTSDRENYGEVISAKMARGITATDDFESVPELKLVYDAERKRTPIASKYSEGDKVRTLDAFIQEKCPEMTLTNSGKNLKFVDGSKKSGGADPKKEEYDISGEENASLRQGLAKGIAISIFAGDHDINPGNFVVTQKDGKERVSRIDFGHAFNDLLNAPKKFGGQVGNQDNQVLDFLNRENVAGFNAKSKFWRGYPGMIPTEEMADAFAKVSQSVGLEQGAANAKKAFTDLLGEMKENNDQAGINHLKKTLNAISSNISGSQLDPKLTPKETIEAAISTMETFASNQQNQMKDVGKLLKLQVDIDKMISGKRDGAEPAQEQIDAIKSAYEDLRKAPGIAQKDGGLEWVKTDSEKSAHKGDLESYLKQRQETLNLTGYNRESDPKISVDPKDLRLQKQEAKESAATLGKGDAENKDKAKVYLADLSDQLSKIKHNDPEVGKALKSVKNQIEPAKGFFGYFSKNLKALFLPSPQKAMETLRDNCPELCDKLNEAMKLSKSVEKGIDINDYLLTDKDQTPGAFKVDKSGKEERVTPKVVAIEVVENDLDKAIHSQEMRAVLNQLKSGGVKVDNENSSNARALTIKPKNTHEEVGGSGRI